MNTFGIVALSLMAGLFLAILVAGLGISIWAALRVKAAAAQIDTKTTKIYAETVEILAEHRVQMDRINESAKSNFVAIRTEMRGSIETLLREVKATLEGHQKAMEVSVSKINGDALLAASERSQKACLRIEKAAVLISQSLFTPEDGGSPEAVGKPWPDDRAEEYAPKGATIYDVTTVGRMDNEVMEAENEEGIG